MGQRIAIRPGSVSLSLQHPWLPALARLGFTYSYVDLQIDAALPVSADVRGGVRISLSGLGFVPPGEGMPCDVACQIGEVRVAATYVPGVDAGRGGAGGGAGATSLVCVSPPGHKALGDRAGAGCRAGEVVCGSVGLEVTVNGHDFTRSGLTVSGVSGICCS